MRIDWHYEADVIVLGAGAVVRSDKLPSAIAKIRLKTKHELKYRIVHQSQYEYQSYTCVVMYR